MNDDRKCEECSSPLIRRDKEQLFHFKKRRFCNIKCVHKNNTEEISDNMPCNICKNTLPLEAFHKRKGRPRGVNYTCKECLKKRNNARSYLPIMTGVKKCYKCLIDKDVSCYHANKKSKDGRSGVCNRCQNDKKIESLRNNPQKRILNNLRRRLQSTLKGFNKSDSTLSLIGCTSEYLRNYISSQFKDGMGWSNYGEWHIDHKKPCSLFDLTIAENQYECFNYKNLQPLWAEDNLRKGNSYE